MKQSYLKSSGFTLVETLIAVAILMVAIAGPLTIANQALTSALGSRNAMIATYLAQDGMESIKNIKDNNLANIGFIWSNVVSNVCTSLSPCQVPSAWNVNDGSFTKPAPQVFCGNSNISCVMYTSDTNGYSYLNSGTLTPFTRYYYVTNPTPTEMIVTVVVSWIDGSIPNQIQLQELMTNVKR